MDTKDKIIIILSIITVILTMISVVLAVPGAVSAIDNLLHPQTSTPEIIQENSTNNNTNGITSSTVSNSTIGNDDINTKGNDNIVGNNNSKTTYYINNSNPTPTSTATFIPIKLPNYNNSIGMEFLKIPSGSFFMGDDDLYYDGHYFASPEHKVDIKSFYLGKCEVTQGQWIEVMGKNNLPFNYLGDNYPVDTVNCSEIQKFIKKLNEKEKTNKYRLPSESEWEYACRANTTTLYYFGDKASQLDDYEWFVRNSQNCIHEVGKLKENPWGFCDMLGNVYEIVMDSWQPDYRDASSNGSAWGNGDSGYEVIRGGSLESPASECLSANRFEWYSDFNHQYMGFRLVMEV